MIKSETIPDSFTQARARYLATLKDSPPILSDRAIRLAYRASVALWSRFPGHLSLLCAIGLTFLVCRFAISSEVPDRVIAAIAQVETGTEWRDMGDVRGKWSHGGIGEVSPWQLSPAVLRDLKAYDRRHRVHADVVLAESLTRAWLLRLYGVTGCWSQTCAAFHAGLAGRHRPHARAYAERVMALASVL
jgi:hypothetical protein